MPEIRPLGKRNHVIVNSRGWLKQSSNPKNNRKLPSYLCFQGFLNVFSSFLRLGANVMSLLFSPSDTQERMCTALYVMVVQANGWPWFGTILDKFAERVSYEADIPRNNVWSPTSAAPPFLRHKSRSEFDSFEESTNTMEIGNHGK